MKLVSDVMDPPVWVCPDHTVKMAFVTMRGYGVDSVAVVESGAYLGMVRCTNLIEMDPAEPLLGAMLRDAPSIGSNATIQEAADMLLQTGAERLPVVDEGVLLGVLSARNLLQEIGRAVDPLTGLPWSDSLREWALSKFRAGDEVTILFMDLDEFGQFNKRFGHLVGDQVLRAVAETLEQGMDPERDFLCRYGGDEFAIASLRGSEGTKALGASLEADVSQLAPATDDTAMSIAWGVCGGKRTREREDVHYASTLDNLINLASRECQSMKERKKVGAGEETGEAGGVSLTLQSMSVSEEPDMTKASVELSAGNRVFSASFAGQSEENGTAMVVAQAAADAISHALPNDTTLVVHEAQIFNPTEGQPFAKVIATLYTPTKMKELQGTYVVQRDPYRAVALAMISAAEPDVLELMAPPPQP